MSNQVLLKRARRKSECIFCEAFLGIGSEVTVTSSGLVACALCATLFWRKPDNYEEFYRVRSSMSAAECVAVLDSGRCDPACLLAQIESTCDCSCGGEFHGSLRDAVSVAAGRMGTAPNREQQLAPGPDPQSS